MQPEDVNPGFHIYISGSDNTTVKVISDAFQHAEESLIEGPPRGLMSNEPAYLPHPNKAIIWVGRNLRNPPAAPTREIAKWQEEDLIGVLPLFKKGPVCVVALSNSQETLEFSAMLRHILDQAGFADPQSPDVIHELGPSVFVPNNPQAIVLYSPGPFPDYVQDFPRMFAEEAGLRLPLAVDPKNVLHLQPNQVAVVVMGK